MRNFGFICLLLAGLAQADVTPPSTVTVTDEQLFAAVKKAASSYNGMVKEELNLDRQKSVRVDISTSEEDYSARLGAYGGSNAARDAKFSGGVTFHDKRLIVVKALVPYNLEWISKTIFHEMTHALQNELASGSASRARPWIDEGMADFVAALAAQKQDGPSIEAWQLQTINTLRLADAYPTPQDLMDGDEYDWHTSLEKTHGKNYRMADLMLNYLYEQKGRKLFKELAGYYHCLANGFTSEKTCFTENFGTTPEQFLPAVQAWVGTKLGKDGSIDIVTNGQDAIGAEVGNVHTVLQVLLEEKFGRKLDTSLRIYLSKSPEEMTEQIVKEAGKTKEDAAKLSKFSPSTLIGHIGFIDTSRGNTSEKWARMIDQTVMASYLASRSVEIPNVLWLRFGFNDATLAQLMEKLHMRLPEQTVVLRKKTLEHAKNGLPNLSELVILADWKKAVDKYGYAQVIQVQSDAVLQLMKKKDGAAIKAWLNPKLRANGYADPFSNAFGETIEHVTQNFKLGDIVD